MTDKNKAFLDEICKDTGGYGNGHCCFMITNLAEADLDVLLDYLQALPDYDPDNFYCLCEAELKDNENGTKCLVFNTHNKYMPDVGLAKLSEKFPNAICYGTDCWDYPELTYCFGNGKELCLTRIADIIDYTFRYNEDASYGDSKAFDLYITIADKKTGAEFEFGGGALNEDTTCNLISLVSLCLSLSDAEDYPDEIDDDL